jgi:hypothetical protein
MNLAETRFAHSTRCDIRARQHSGTAIATECQSTAGPLSQHSQSAVLFVARQHISASCTLSTPVSPATCSAPEGFLVDLPLATLYPVLHRAGRRTRELCTAFAHVYGPLPHLAPWGVETIDELLSALAPADDRHRHLTRLDLSRVGNLVTCDSLLSMCEALPNLRSLRLAPWDRTYASELTAPAVAAATSRLLHLEELHVPFLPAAIGAGPLPEGPCQGSSHLRELTLPIGLIAPSVTALSGCTALRKVCVHALQDVNISHLASLAAELPALLSLEQVGSGRLYSIASLQSLTQLTALGLCGAVSEEGATTGQLLRHVGTLTNLRSLALRLWLDWGEALERGWLTRLSRLTSLQVTFATREVNIDDYDAFFDVPSSVPLLPALCELKIAGTYNAASLSAAACAYVASARSSLKSLHLRELRLPASMFVHVMPQLTCLSCLRLEYVIHPDEMVFIWLSILTALRELWYDGRIKNTGCSGVLPCGLLAGLSSVDTLSLPRCPAVDGPYLEQLCELMPQLRSLNLSYNSNMGAGLHALQRLTNLEVLGLAPYYGVSLGDTLQHLRAPLNLGRCYVGRKGPEKEASSIVLLSRQVDIMYADWKR